MKPPAFDYLAPVSLDEALAALAAHEGAARPLAGGQSLIPVLNFRLGGPEVLVDLGRVPELAGMTSGDAETVVGAMTPTAGLLGGPGVLASAARLVGHPQIRSRGTVGGSIAHGDPAAELPAVAVLTGATVELTSARGRRAVAAEDFFLGLFETSCEWDELVTAVRFPHLSPMAGWGFREFARRPGDFALAGIGMTVELDGDVIAATRVVAFGLAPTPLRMRAAEDRLVGRDPVADVIAEARAALTAALDPADTPHGSGSYRRHLAGVLFERALADALRMGVFA